METYNFSKKVVFSPEVYETISKNFPNDYYSISFYSNYYLWSEELSDEFADELISSDNILQFERILKKLWTENGIKLGLKKELPKEDRLDIMRIELTKVINSISSFTFWYRNWMELYYPELLIEGREDIIPVDIDSSTNAIDKYINEANNPNDQGRITAKMGEQKEDMKHIINSNGEMKSPESFLVDPTVAQEDSTVDQFPGPNNMSNQNLNVLVTDAIIRLNEKLTDLESVVKRQNLRKASSGRIKKKTVEFEQSDEEVEDREFAEEQYFFLSDNEPEARIVNKGGRMSNPNVVKPGNDEKLLLIILICFIKLII